MTVAELIAFLQTQPQGMRVAYRCFSEQCLMDVDGIAVKTLSTARPDGWIQNYRSDKPSETYLVFPGN